MTLVRAGASLTGRAKFAPLTARAPCANFLLLDGYLMNNNLFRTTPGGLILPADAVNNAGGAAYGRPPEEALAQFAATGCFGDTFYVKAEDQLKDVLDLAAKCSPEWIAKCAVYARESGLMKDMPAILCAILAVRDVPLLKVVFPRCINNGKMLRNFVQIVRSGAVGRKSFGTAVKKLIQKWFASRTDEQLFHASIGEKPSLSDIIKMVHPKPHDEARRCMFAYLMGKPVAALGLLPQIVQDFEAFKLGVGPAPDINFQFLSSLQLTEAQWGAIADRASWQTVRMNLNTFQRHGVFNDTERLGRIIERLRDKAEIAKARPMPHQMLAAFLNVAAEAPPGIKMALAQAVELALENVPKLPANTILGVDVSGSMSSAITGARGSATSAMRCVDVAALLACALLRTTPTAKIVAFDTRPHQGTLGGSLVECAKTLASFGGGGTNCAIPLVIAAQQPKVDAVVIVSDNESWVDWSGHGGRGPSVMPAWRMVQARNPNAKLVCIDLTPSSTRQTMVEKNVLNVGGFSDAVFDVVAAFLNESRSWCEVIGAVELSPVRESPFKPLD